MEHYIETIIIPDCWHRDVPLYSIKRVLDVFSLAERKKLKILGVEGFIIDGEWRIPIPDAIIDLSGLKDLNYKTLIVDIENYLKPFNHRKDVFYEIIC